MLILGIRFIVVLIIVTKRAADLVGIAFTAAQTIIAGIRSLRTSGRTGAYGVSEIIVWMNNDETVVFNLMGAHPIETLVTIAEGIIEK